MKATEMLHILKTQNKRLFIICIITFIAFICLLGYTIYLLNDVGTIEETKRGLKYMLESMEDFARMLRDQAGSQEEVEMIRQTAQKIAQM